MLKTRIILIAASAIVIWLIFLLPKAVIENESQLKSADSTSSHKGAIPAKGHREIPATITSSNEKNAIFADSLQNLYTQAGQFDSAAAYGAEAATFFNTTESFLKAGNSYYEASTFAMDAQKQRALAEKAREWLGKVI